MSRLRGFEVVGAYAEKGIALPVRKTAASAGYDLAAAEAAVLAPGECALIPTGLKAYMQPDEVLFIYIRSSLAARHSLTLTNSVGIIDADYYDNPQNEGHIYIALRNDGTKPVSFERGERLAQGIFSKYLTADGDLAGEGARREGGFGSTGCA